MKTKLFLRASVRALAALTLTALFLLVPAGTFRWPNAWLLLALLGIPALITGAVLLRRAPELLEKRLRTGESDPVQKKLVFLSLILASAALTAAGLNFRYGGLLFPNGAVIIGAALLSAGYLLYAETLRENHYLSRTVECGPDQKVIQTGVYRFVRHPMYAAALIIFLAIPLILASPVSLAVSLLFLPIIVLRIKNEEKLLAERLEGYAAYKTKVKWRLLPRIW